MLLTRVQYINSAADLLGLPVEAVTARVEIEDAGSRKFQPGVFLTSGQTEAYVHTAEALATYAVTNALTKLVRCDLAQAPCVDGIIAGWGARAFHRPLEADQRRDLRALFDAGVASTGLPATGVEWLLTGILQAPEFVYQNAVRPALVASEGVVPLDDYDIAARLAFFLWNGLPDADLDGAAAKGALRSDDQIAEQVRRMLGNARSRRSIEDFYRTWAHLDNLDRLSREAREFTPVLAQALKRSFLAGINELYGTGDGNLRTLLEGRSFFVNDVLSNLYGPTRMTGGSLRAAELDPSQRRGVLTHPALMTVLARPDGSDPITRGVWIRRELLCQDLPPPPPGVDTNLPTLRPGLSTRQRLQQHASDAACRACHNLIDPVGFGFESYDGIGRFRARDQGVAVDASGEVVGGGDVEGKFRDTSELIARLAPSNTLRDCLAETWLEHALMRDLEPKEACTVAPVKQRLRSNGDLRALLADIALSAPFRSRSVTKE